MCGILSWSWIIRLITRNITCWILVSFNPCLIMFGWWLRFWWGIFESILARVSFGLVVFIIGKIIATTGGILRSSRFLWAFILLWILLRVVYFILYVCFVRAAVLSAFISIYVASLSFSWSFLGRFLVILCLIYKIFFNLPIINWEIMSNFIQCF